MGILKDMFSKVFMSKERRQQQVQTSLIEEFRYPKYGPGQLWETTAQEIEKLGGKVVKGCEVLGARTENGKVVSLRVRDGEGEHDMEGDVFFSSMPIKDLVAGMNDVPTDVQAIAAGLPYRDFVTVGLLVDRLNLKNETKLKTLGNIVPDCWIYVQDADVKLGRIQIFNNWSPYLVKDPEHTVWIGLEYFCNEGDAFWSASEEETVHQAVSELIRMATSTWITLWPRHLRRFTFWLPEFATVPPSGASTPSNPTTSQGAEPLDPLTAPCGRGAA